MALLRRDLATPDNGRVVTGFVSEAIAPIGAFDADSMGRAEPGFPQAFNWRDEVLTPAKVVRQWKTTKEDRGDNYVKRHYYEVALTDGRIATIYFDRGARRNAPRWYLFKIESTSSRER